MCLCVCVRVCMHAHVCMFACMCVRKHVLLTYKHVQVNAHDSVLKLDQAMTETHQLFSVYTLNHTHTHARTHMHAHTHTHTHTHTHAHTHTHTHTHNTSKETHSRNNQLFSLNSLPISAATISTVLPSSSL